MPFCKLQKLKLPPASTRTGTILVLLVLVGIGLLNNFGPLVVCLFMVLLFGVFTVGNIFIVVCHAKGVWVFSLLTGVSLLLTKEGRALAPILMVKMFSMWLWSVIWIKWVGFERILSTLEKMGIPAILLNVIAFTTRFLPIMGERIKMTFAAQSSRGAKKGLRSLQLRNLAGGIGSVLLSSFEQSENVERAMQSRGFCGTYTISTDKDEAPSYVVLSLMFLMAFLIWTGVICDVLCGKCL
ncbi:putative membrane protein [Candidatus Kuenenia stuttgartiensis]|uniref:Putative membrane protein n=1 Tax=Kuenenia stuttgartiensis TaxID=174633 RepID=Q1Q0F5_KUEST|nr:energy-coupling factor transporter transmembrane component T [Candidatus Kuenenia stuttgartiensis]QII10641.1 putative membrane protein [Candidatus Kuenenia stuttgartiensis]CAJ72011.1 conserved hypothetical protein [Candidatus Kuenenia stuttgartiensis]SOH05186.1 hypothetical protein KSMBR1_2699 [Candidatus Kuenenia stuttgartiensis]